MKKYLTIFLVAGILGVSACKTTEPVSVLPERESVELSSEAQSNIEAQAERTKQDIDIISETLTNLNALFGG